MKVFGVALPSNKVFKEYVTKNNLTIEVCKKVIENKGLYNPLFITGATGTGKTLLAKEVAKGFAKDLYNVKYAIAEEFYNDLTHAIRNNTNEQFRDTYRNVDVLVLDDIDFFEGKTVIQEELLHTMKSLLERNSQIILTSTKRIDELQSYDYKLISRFSKGIEITTDFPDYEIRLAILKENYNLPIDTLKELAQEEITDINVLLGKVHLLSEQRKSK